tara:strand:- start:1144 stop:1452 length:309 start_codon:yes stop_codon:yes gene_type:complete
MTKEDKKELSITLTTYIALKKNQGECTGFIEGFEAAIKYKNQGQTLPIDFVSETLTLDNLTVHPIDKEGDFEIELDCDSYRYIDSEQARVLIKHLQDNLNAR